MFCKTKIVRPQVRTRLVSAGVVASAARVLAWAQDRFQVVAGQAAVGSSPQNWDRFWDRFQWSYVQIFSLY